MLVFILFSSAGAQVKFLNYNLKNFQLENDESFEVFYDTLFNALYKEIAPVYFDEVIANPSGASYKFTIKNPDFAKVYNSILSLDNDNSYNNSLFYPESRGYIAEKEILDSIKKYFIRISEPYYSSKIFRGYSGDNELLADIIMQKIVFLFDLIQKEKLTYDQKISFKGNRASFNIKWDKNTFSMESFYRFEKISNPHILFGIDITDFNSEEGWDLVDGVYHVDKNGKDVLFLSPAFFVDDILRFPIEKKFQFVVSSRLIPDYTLYSIVSLIPHFDMEFENHSYGFEFLTTPASELERLVVYGKTIIDLDYFTPKYKLNIFWKKRLLVVTVYDIDMDNSKEFFN